MPLSVKSFEFNPFGETTYIIYDPATLEAAVVDPGFVTDAERVAFDTFVADNNLQVKYLVNTHLHVDHSFGIAHVEARYGVGLSASEADAPLGRGLADQARMFHLPVKIDGVEIDRPLRDGDILRLGDNDLRVIAVAGHTPGGIALYAPADRFVVTGDSLFYGSIGRTDLPGGDHATLVGSITDGLLALPDDTVVYPGHGPSTTIGRERRYNPYL